MLCAVGFLRQNDKKERDGYQKKERINEKIEYLILLKTEGLQLSVFIWNKWSKKGGCTPRGVKVVLSGWLGWFCERGIYQRVLIKELL